MDLSLLSSRVVKRWLKLSSESIDDSVLKWLFNRTKKGKGTVQIPVVEKAFEVLPGWSIVNTTTYLLLNGNSHDVFEAKLKTWSEKWKIRISGALTTKEPYLFYGMSPEAKEDLKSEVNWVTSKGKLPSGVAQVGALYVTPLIEIEKWGNKGIGVSQAWLGVPGWIITSPKGSIVLPSPVRRNGTPEDPNRLEKWGTFWTFIYKFGIENDAKIALEKHKEKIEELSAPAAERKKIQQQRIILPEVEKLLREIVDKQFQNVWDRLTDQHVTVLQFFLKQQEEAWEKVKDEKYPRWNSYKILRDIGNFKKFINEATEVDLRGQQFDLGFGWKKRKNNYLDIARSFAKKIAEDLREEFVLKNGAKLSLIVKTKGNLQKGNTISVFPGEDFGGEIEFEFLDGSKFIVRNKSVFKYSVLGKPFVQFPTTFHEVLLPGGIKMSQPSEQRMVEVFAVS